MSESELVEVVRAAYAAFNRGEVESVLDLFAPDLEWRPPPSSVEPQPLQGRDAVRKYLAPNVFEYQIAEPLEIIEEGDRVLVVVHVQARGRGSGVHVDQVAFHVWTIVGGRAARFEAHVDRDEALAALTAPGG